ncbi:MAG: hypothetical protein Tsb008_06720 [Rhodothalassiaceae bacterium]
MRRHKTALMLAGAAMFDLGVIALTDIPASAQQKDGPAAEQARRGTYLKIEGIAGEARLLDKSFDERACNKMGGKVISHKGDKYCAPKANGKIKDKDKHNHKD